MKPFDHNPDVLSCLANLSNDEVFTPPQIARQMLDLLPASLWRNPEARFLDPCTKSGVFLREIATRLIDGLADWQPDLQKRIDHILGKQLYGIAITELTALISRRTLYCCKTADSELSIATVFDNADGNIRFNRQSQHEWAGAWNAENQKCRYCGASKKQYDKGGEAENHAYEFIHTEHPEKIWNNMKFDVIIGNPPYQIGDKKNDETDDETNEEIGKKKRKNNGGSASPIYHKFIRQAQKLQPHYLVMITPSRWFAGGKGLDDFRDEMLGDTRLRQIHDFPNAADCFPGIEIKGGVNYFLWDRDDRGDCLIRNYEGGVCTSESVRPLREDGMNTLVRYNNAISILRKVTAKKEKKFSELVSSQKPFGLRTFVKGKNNPFPNSIKLYRNNGVGYIEQDDIAQGSEWLDKYKVLITMAYGAGESFPHQILNTPFIAEKGAACSETYLVIAPSTSLSECQNVISYIKTRFFRFLVLLNKPTQHASQKVYQFVPIQDFSRPWTDAGLYAKYGLTADEIAFIEKMVRPMD